MYANRSVLFCCKLQTEITLSITQVEYIVLNQATREVLPFINLLSEINEAFPPNRQEPKFHYKVFKNNNSYILLATAHKFSPRTKHVALNYNNFRWFVKYKHVEISPIDTKKQTIAISKKLWMKPYSFI